MTSRWPSTETVENLVETSLGLRPKSFQPGLLVRSALCDSSVTEARDLRDGLFRYEDAGCQRDRAVFTASASASTTVSTSAASLYRPSPKRKAVYTRSSGSPMARRTCEPFPSDSAQAAPDDKAIEPPRERMSVSASARSMETWRLPGRRGSAAPLSSTPSMCFLRP